MGSEIGKEAALHKLCVHQLGGSVSGSPGLPVPDLMGLLRNALLSGKVLEGFYQFY